MKKIFFLLIILFGLFKDSYSSVPPDSTKFILQTWVLKNGHKIDNIPVDTSLRLFQIFHPIEKSTISSSTLGNMGSAGISNIFHDRKLNYWEDFIFHNSFSGYYYSPENVIYYKTNRPFTDLFYTTSRKEKDEQTIRLLHTQNINKNLNLGVKLNIVSSKGSFVNQRTRNNAITGWMSYRGLRYQMHSNICFNKFKVQENGGIIDTNINYENIFVNLTKARTKIYNRSLYLTHEYKLGKIDSAITVDSVKYLTIKEKSAFVHTLLFEKDYRIFEDEDANNKFYRKPLIDTNQTIDSASLFKIKNSFYYRTGPNKNFNLLAGVILENLKYYRFANYFFNPQNTQYNNLFLSGNIFSSDSALINWDVVGKYGISGYRKNDILFQAACKKTFRSDSDSMYIALKGSYNIHEPGYYYQHYTSNYYKWDNNFDKIKEINAGISFNKPKWRLELGAEVSLINNYIYFNDSCFPKQFKDPLQIASVYLNKDFVFWKLHLINKIIYQKISNTKILPLPDLAIYHAAYFEFDLFKRALHSQIGFDVTYTTQYFAPAYNPALAQFYNENKYQTQTIPIVDFFINTQIKNVFLFLKWEHMNAIADGKYGSVAEIFKSEKTVYETNKYPINNFFFKFGVSWRFKN